MIEHWAWHALGWVAFGLNVWGNMMLTTKTRSGWVVRFVCNVCWLPYAVLTGAWALLANHILFMGINVLGWIRWRSVSQSDEFDYVDPDGVGWTEEWMPPECSHVRGCWRWINSTKTVWLDMTKDGRIQWDDNGGDAHVEALAVIAERARKRYTTREGAQNE